MLCYLIGHNWTSYNHLESRCKRCGRFKIFYGYADTSVYSESIEDKKEADKDTETYNKEIAYRKRNYELFEKIVTDNPLTQIDWIIEKGFSKFSYWWDCMESGSIYSPATVHEQQKVEDSSVNKRVFKRVEYVAYKGQSVFNLEIPYNPHQNELSVYLGGAIVTSNQYQETSPTSITINDDVAEHITDGMSVVIGYLSEEIETVREVVYVRGGFGNPKLLSWSYERR